MCILLITLLFLDSLYAMQALTATIVTCRNSSVLAKNNIFKPCVDCWDSMMLVVRCPGLLCAHSVEQCVEVHVDSVVAQEFSLLVGFNIVPSQSLHNYVDETH